MIRLCVLLQVVLLADSLHAATPVVIEATVAAPSQGAASRPAPELFPLDRGAADGVAAGDGVFLVADGSVRALGSLVVSGESGAVARLDGASPAPSPGSTLRVLRRAALAELADRLPPGVTMSAAVLRIPPGRGSCWMDMGASAGFKPGDGVLIRRPVREITLPIARGSIGAIEDGLALAVVRPVVQMDIASVQAGDLVERWPRPHDARQGRINSAVLEVLPAGGATRLFIAGGADDGLSEGRLVDVFRQGAYIGVALIGEVRESVSIAQLISAASTDRPPMEGDEALVRAPAGERELPLAAAIFQVITDGGTTYCLIAAGESDGVAVGDRFVVRRTDPQNELMTRRIAELWVEKSDETYCRATVRPLDAGVAPVAVWEMAERASALPRRWVPIGIVREVNAEHRMARADLNPRIHPEVGTLLRWVPEQVGRSPGAGVLLATEGESGWLHVPPGWGALSGLRLARLEVELPEDDEGDVSQTAPDNTP